MRRVLLGAARVRLHDIDVFGLLRVVPENLPQWGIPLPGVVSSPEYGAFTYADLARAYRVNTTYIVSPGTYAAQTLRAMMPAEIHAYDMRVGDVTF